MKKEITLVYEATVCDYCGEETRLGIYATVCAECGKDVCEKHKVIVHKDRQPFGGMTLCRVHIKAKFPDEKEIDEKLP